MWAKPLLYPLLCISNIGFSFGNTNLYNGYFTDVIPIESITILCCLCTVYVCMNYVCGLCVGPGEYAMLESTELLSCFLNSIVGPTGRMVNRVSCQGQPRDVYKAPGNWTKGRRKGGKEGRWAVVGCVLAMQTCFQVV